jgi:hypothetical protein
MASAAASDSTRYLDANVSLMLGSFLGKTMGLPNKDPVVRLLQPARTHARFNKFTGLLEWRNALVLWINKDSACYENTFSDDWRTVTWFMSESHTLETPVIQRLLHHGAISPHPTASTAAAADDNSDRPCDVVLFCRNQSTGDPYVFCGRVKYVQYFPNRVPVKFLFTLLDRQKLLQEADFCALAGVK